MKRLVLLIVVAVLLSACGPSPEQVQAAIAQTQTAVPTATYTFIPSPTVTSTVTPSPTATITPTPTATFTNTPTLTPTPDIRIIEVDPQKFLLKASEMPEEGKYYIPGQSWMGLNTNEETISSWGVELGREYVTKTGRVTSWYVNFLRGTRATQMPEDVYISVTQFQTSQGAQLAMLKYNNVETNTKYVFKYRTPKQGIGDKYIVEVCEEKTSSGDIKLDYLFEYTYRNYLVRVGLYDLEKYVSHDFALLIGEKVLKKLQSAELVYPPTATPAP